MFESRLRLPALLIATGLALSGCYSDGYGYSRVSIGYGSNCDPYYDNCGSRYRGSYYGDPWYGWYDDYYYPGIGIYIYDRSGRRYRWSDNHRYYWENRRQGYRDRDWSDRRWENWDGYRRGNRDRRWRRRY